MNIRAYQDTDGEAVLALLRSNTPDYFAPEEEQDLVLYLQRDAEHYFVLEDGGRLVACGGFNLWEEGAIARISWDMVQPEGQGKGWGSALVRFRLQEIKKIPTVTTIVVRTSQLAFRFYERFGFRTQEIVTDYWAPGYNLYHMVMAAE
ncbi:GNAT family N-acetyltransferase [Taibaiella koreensis]|uniref:GNAT family N-acetyltransferase n=1 Tax=Taibaiella koreensis TaxID=1268548 RepID=UPI000E599AE1|nr:GNAT family N-acetyltransferase [Taibaiella koreensis]